MEPKYSKIFSKEVLKTINNYCGLNEIEDVDGFIKKCFDTGFNIKKYGLLGKTLNDDEKDLIQEVIIEKEVIKEIIVEKRVDVPVETVKEIEKIVEVVKEVPIEVIKEVEKIVEVIKEIPVETIKEVVIEKPIDRIVEKEIYITDDDQVNELGGKITKLEENILHLELQLDEERKIFSTKTQESEIFFQKEMSKKEKELDEFRRNLDEVRHSLDQKQDNTNEKMLQETLQKLRKELTEKNEKIKELIKINNDLENISKTGKSAVFLRGSNLNDTI